METNKTLNSETLSEVSGGNSHILALKEELLKSLPEDVKEKLNSAPSDTQACKILAESGIDLASLEDKIKKGGFNLKKIGLQLSDSELSEANGGIYIPFIDDLELPLICGGCGNRKRDKISQQFLVSIFGSDVRAAYRCKICGSYSLIHKSGSVEVLTEKDYKDRYF